MANELLGVKFDIYCPANNYEQQEEVVKHLATQGFECKSLMAQIIPHGQR